MAKIVCSTGKISTLRMENIPLMERHTTSVSFHDNTKTQFCQKLTVKCWFVCSEQSKFCIFDVKTRIIVYN